MKIIKRAKRKLRSFYQTVKIVSNGKWDFFLVAVDYAYCRLRFRVDPDEYLKYGFYNFSNRYRKQFLLMSHKRKLRNVNMRGFSSSKYIMYKRIPDLYEREIVLAPQCGEKVFIDFVKKYKEIIIKPDCGSLGKGVERFVYTSEDAARQKFANFSATTPSVCEEYIHQHLTMQTLCPYTVNTIRIVSVLKDGEVEIVSATMRSGAKANCVVDNMLSGGVGAQVDIATGIVSTFGIDYAFNSFAHHPVSGVQIIGFTIPNWEQAIERVKQAHKRLPQCLVFGWDIAITPDGVDIVEVNNSPGSRIMQAMDRVPKGQIILPLIKKDLLKQDKSDKFDKRPDYSQLEL